MSTYLLCAIMQGMQRMVIKQIRNAVQRGLTYIRDQCQEINLHCWTSAQTGSQPFTWKFSSKIASIIRSCGKSEY